MIVSGTRTSRRRRRSGAGGVAASLVLAAAALVAAVVAWPFIQPSLGPVKQRAKKRQVAAAELRPGASRVDDAPAAAGRTAPVQQKQSASIGKPEPTSPPRLDPMPAPQQPAPAAVVEDRTPAPREDDRERAMGAVQATAAVARAIDKAASELRRHQLAGAERALDVADEAAGGDAELEARVNRWRLLVAYAGQLDGHLAEAIASANEGREYTIGERTISIIELGPETFAFKERGKVTRGPRAEFPRVVERAILAAWFDGDPRPANQIFVGLHRLLDDKPDLQRVREAWQEAAAGNEAAAAILPLLDDPAVVAGR